MPRAFLGHNEGALLAEPQLRRIRTRYVALLPCPVSVCFHTIQKLYCTDLKNLEMDWRHLEAIVSEVDKNVPGVLLSFSQPEGQKQCVYAIEQGGARSYAIESDRTRTSGVKDQTKNSLFSILI